MWELPLKWDGSGAAESAWQAPKDAKVLSKPFHLKDLVVEIERVIAAA